MHFDLVVVGGGIAGIQASLEAKRLKTEKSVAVLSDELIPYARPSLTAIVSGARQTIEQIAVFPRSVLSNNNVKFFSKCSVTDIDCSRHIVYAQKSDQKNIDGHIRLTYDKIIIATGSKPFIPRIEGLNLQGVFTIRRFDDAVMLSKFLRKGMTAHVLGAGFVGLEVADALIRRGLNTTLLIRSRILRGILEPDFSQIVTDKAKTHCINIITGCNLQRIEGKRKVERILINNCEKLRSDLVIFAAGVTPNTDLAKRMGILTAPNCAIRSDKHTQTNIHGVYATGDCSETLDFITGASVYRPIASVGSITAKIAAANGVGVHKAYEGIVRKQYNKVFGAEIVSMGLSSEEANRLGMETKSYSVRFLNPHFMPLSGIVSKNSMKMIVTEKTGAIVGWQVIGKRQSSLLSPFMFDCISKRCRLEDMHAFGPGVMLASKENKPTSVCA